MKKLFRENIIRELLIIFVLSLTPLLWFRPGQLMLGHDNTSPLEPKEFLLGRLTTWVDHAFGQNQSLIMGTIPIHLIDAIPYLLGFSIHNTQKMVYVFWFFMIGVSMYTLMKTLKKGNWFIIVATILYQFNFFILQGWWVGEKSKFSAFIALPLVLAVFYKVYRKEFSVLTGIAANTLILFFFNGAGLYGVPLFGGFFISLGVFIMLYSFVLLRESRFDAVRLPLLAGGTLLASFAVNSYFWLPAASALLSKYTSGVEAQGGLQGLIEWATEISANSSFINLMRLQGIAEWYDNLEHPFAKYFFSNPWLILASFVWPFLVLFSLRRQKDKVQELLTIYFLFVYLLGLLLTAGTHEPLGFIYVFLVKTIPGFGIFRTPYFKFAPAVYLAASYLCASAVDRLPGKIKKAGFIIIAVLIFAYNFPYFTGEFFGWRKGFSTRLTVPSYVFDFGNWLNREKKDDYRVLVLPPNNPDLRYSMYDWGYLSFQSIATLMSNNPVIINNDRISDEEKTLILILYQSIASKDKTLFTHLASTMRTGYIVLQHDSASDRNIDLPVDANIYKQILEDDFHLVPLRSFGRWTIYSTGITPIPRVTLVSSVNRLDSLSSDVWKYYNFSTSPFFVRNDDLPSHIDMPQNGKYIIADCVNCKAKDKPFIKIPERNILPDSPFYPFIIWKEQRNLHKGDPKSLIYDYLGISLKRVAEIREMIKEYKPISAPVLRRFIDLMDALAKTFTMLEKYEDKIDVGDDIKFYLESERNVLAELLGIYVISGNQVNALGQVTQAISSTLLAIEPYVLIPDQMKNRLYQIQLNSPQNLSLNVYTGDFQSIAVDSIPISLSIDQNVVFESKLALYQPPSWMQLGTWQLDAGTHYIMLTYPETPNTVLTLASSITEFNTSSDMGCFTGEIKDFDYKKLYRVKVNYNNNFSNELFFNIWEYSGDSKRLKNVFRLPPSQVKGEFNRLIKTYADTKGVQIGFCSRGLTDDILQKNLSVTVNELLYPTVFFIGQEEQGLTVGPVEVKKIGVTSYDISLTTTSPNNVLSFFERYDSGWQLSGFEKNHFRMNGYANGWLIEKPGTYNLKLSFKPQKTFEKGVLISALSVLGAILLLIRKKTQKS